MPTRRRFTVGPRPRRKAAVFSHERSGTHFLMNTLALNFGYVSRPWWNLDFEHGVNFHAPEALDRYLRQAHDKPVLNVLKSHHCVGFVDALMDYLLEQFHVFYVYRDPRDVMTSAWRYYHRVPWDEGPKVGSVSEFLRAEPAGGMLRYQKRQAPTVLHRWAAHVEGWLDAAEARGGAICALRFEDLNGDFEQSVSRIARHMGEPAGEPRRPPKDRNVVVPGSGGSGAHREHFGDADEAFVREQVGATFARLGYR